MVIDFGVEETEIEFDEILEEDDVFIRYDIATYPSDLTIQVLKDMWDQEDIEIPRFQRNFVWTIKQSSLLIESFLLGLPVPQAFFYIDESHKNLVIDGQQRITSLVYFLDGFFGDENFQGKRQVFRLTGLSNNSPFLKKRFVDLEEKDRRKLLGAVLRIVNIRQMSPKDQGTAAYHIFERLNTGGTPLKPQEIRNCVFHGPIVDALNTLNADKNWRKIIGRPHLEKHQRDVEMLLRIYAMFEGWERYEKPMKEFLNKSMQTNKELHGLKFPLFFASFPVVCKKIVESFGEKPFHVRGPINLAAMDSVMAIALRNNEEDFKNFSQKFGDLKDDADFQELIFFNTSDATTVKARMQAVAEIIR